MKRLALCLWLEAGPFLRGSPFPLLADPYGLGVSALIRDQLATADLYDQARAVFAAQRGAPTS